jgi:hypothetical protein
LAEVSRTAKSAAHERLHRLVDALPESMIESVATALEVFVHRSDHPAWASLRRAMEDMDFDDLSDEDRKAIQEAYDDIEAGAQHLSHDEVTRRWHEAE